MKIGIFGGAFNPPHRGHVGGAAIAAIQLGLDLLYIIPTGVSPHKDEPAGSPAASFRLELSRIAFSGVPSAVVSSVEIDRAGESYTADTLFDLMSKHAGAEFYLIVGTDMYSSLDSWYNHEFLLQNCTPVLLARYNAGDVSDASARLRALGAEPYFIESDDILEVSSSEIRAMLPLRLGSEYLNCGVYNNIISKKLYNARPDFDFLRFEAYGMLEKKRIRHVAGCEYEAVSLAHRWGINSDDAREAAILHDITKSLTAQEHIAIMEEAGYAPEPIELQNEKLLHARTSAIKAKQFFGVSGDVFSAIWCHTTGKPGMNMLEKIMYTADFIEPSREFTEPWFFKMRERAYFNIDEALEIGLRQSIIELEASGKEIHPDSVNALKYLKGNENN